MVSRPHVSNYPEWYWKRLSLKARTFALSHSGPQQIIDWSLRPARAFAAVLRGRVFECVRPNGYWHAKQHPKLWRLRAMYSKFLASLPDVAVSVTAPCSSTSSPMTTSIYVDRWALRKRLHTLAKSIAIAQDELDEAETWPKDDHTPDVVRLLRTAEQHCTAMRRTISMVRTILLGLDRDGMYVQEYRMGKGRRYGHRGSLQLMPRDWRLDVLPGLDDWDIENCYYNLINQLTCRRYAAINRYCEHREHTLSLIVAHFALTDRPGEDGSVKKGRDIVKEALLALIFGKSARSVLRALRKLATQTIGEASATKLRFPAPVLSLVEDLVRARDELLARKDGQAAVARAMEEHAPLTEAGKHIYWNKHMCHGDGAYDRGHAPNNRRERAGYTKERWLKDCRNTALSEVLMTAEGKAIGAVEEYIHSIGGVIRLFMHDGWMSDRSLPVNAEHVSQWVFESTGLRLRFARK